MGMAIAAITAVPSHDRSRAARVDMALVWSKAGPWINHVRLVYPNDADHLINFFAHRIQRPHEKINHAIVLLALDPEETGRCRNRCRI